MREGRITLLYKGKGLDRALPASYRPVTLLNTDYKLAARVLADKFGLLLNYVVDSTRTGFYLVQALSAESASCTPARQQRSPPKAGTEISCAARAAHTRRCSSC